MDSSKNLNDRASTPNVYKDEIQFAVQNSYSYDEDGSTFQEKRFIKKILKENKDARD